MDKTYIVSSVETPDFHKKLTATESIEASRFRSVDRRFQELLMAAEGIQQLGTLLDITEHETDCSMPHIGCLVESLGKHVQNLRNEAAEELEPIFKSFDAEAIGY